MQSYAFFVLALTEWIDTGNVLDGVKLHLYTAGPNENRYPVPGDFTEAAFAGYAAVTVTWSVVYLGEAGEPQVDTQLAHFLSNNVSANETIVGWYLMNTGGTVVYDYAEFATPFQIAGDDSGFGLVVSEKVDSHETAVV